MPEDPSENRAAGRSPLERLGRQPTREEPPLPGARSGGLLARITHDEPTGETADSGPSLTVSERLARQLTLERAQCDLLLILCDAPAWFQRGQLTKLFGAGETGRSPSELTNAVEPGRCFIVTNTPHLPEAEFRELVQSSRQVDLMAPELARFYRFGSLAAAVYRGTEPPLPLLIATEFPMLELTLASRAISADVREAIEEGLEFEGLLGPTLSAAVTRRGGAVYEVRYWLAHQAASHGVGQFRPDELDCLWSADSQRIAEALNHGVELGAVHVSPSAFARASAQASGRE